MSILDATEKCFRVTQCRMGSLLLFGAHLKQPGRNEDTMTLKATQP